MCTRIHRDRHRDTQTYTVTQTQALTETYIYTDTHIQRQTHRNTHIDTHRAGPDHCFRSGFTSLWAKSLQSCLALHDPRDCSLPVSPSVGFSRQEYWSGLPFSPPGNLRNPGIKPASLMYPALGGRFFTISATWEALYVIT